MVPAKILPRAPETSRTPKSAGTKESFPEKRERVCLYVLRAAGEHDEMVAPGGERLSFEPAVDGLDLEPSEPEH